jgi:ubiquinone/menaquinone biosynthesis C-methylase UbiE
MTETLGRYQSFDPVAAEYDRTRHMPHGVLEDIARTCGREAGLYRTGRFLDAAVGTGRFAVPLADFYPGRVIGVDISSAMIAQARTKSSASGPDLVIGDVQRLPFRTGAFAGVLAVHLLHLVEGWRGVLDELRRVTATPSGVLLLGGEQGGRSALVDFYYERARARGVLAPSLGISGLSPALAYLRRDPRAQVQMLSLPHLKWFRTASLAETLGALAHRTYSQMWNIPDDAHAELMAETREYASRTLGSPQSPEKVEARFVLYATRWVL